MANYKSPVLDRAVAAIAEALRDIETNNGKEFYRKDWDKGLKVYGALKRAGLKIIRQKQPKATGKTLCEVLTAD